MYSQLKGYMFPSQQQLITGYVYNVPFAEVQSVKALFPYELLSLSLLLLSSIAVLVASSSVVFIVASLKLRLVLTLCRLGSN